MSRQPTIQPGTSWRCSFQYTLSSVAAKRIFRIFTQKPEQSRHLDPLPQIDCRLRIHRSLGLASWKERLGPWSILLMQWQLGRRWLLSAWQQSGCWEFSVPRFSASAFMRPIHPCDLISDQGAACETHIQSIVTNTYK